MFQNRLESPSRDRCEHLSSCVFAPRPGFPFAPAARPLLAPAAPLFLSVPFSRFCFLVPAFFLFPPLCPSPRFQGCLFSLCFLLVSPSFPHRLLAAAAAGACPSALRSCSPALAFFSVLQEDCPAVRLPRGGGFPVCGPRLPFGLAVSFLVLFLLYLCAHPVQSSFLHVLLGRGSVAGTSVCGVRAERRPQVCVPGSLQSLF